MGWPTPQDYNEAMQAPWLNLSDRALKSGKPALDILGLPRPMTGAFASVYKLECDGRAFAVKLFLRKVPDQEVRYTELSNSINSKELLYTVGFQYQPEGVSIRAANYPILKMEWVEGDTLDLYINEHISEPRTIEMLLHQFKKVVQKLQSHGIAHGDLQHGNMLVKDTEIKLVDYDGMYVPKLKGFPSNELGHPNYQQPRRHSGHFGPYMDNFSAWVIHTSLLCLSVDATLWQQLNGGDDCLLFRRKDFEDANSSATFKLLENHQSEVIRNNAKLLRYMLIYPPEHVPPLDEKIAHINHLPAIRPVEVLEIKTNTAPAGSTSGSKPPTPTGPPPAAGFGLPDWMLPGPAGISSQRRQDLRGEWPRYDQYKQAMQEPHLTLNDPMLKLGKYVPETKGLGNSGFVFHLRCPNRHVAVKCFRNNVPDRAKRFDAIRKYTTGDARRYFLEFRYLPEGILIGDNWWPILAMDWVTPTLNDYIQQNTRNRSRLVGLADNFSKMVRALQTIGIAHGDLEPENLAIVNNDFKLLDYDGMYVPELDGLSGIERGHPAFQHPSRLPDDFGPNLDFFSAWILSAELQYLTIDPQLWSQAELRSKVAVAKTSRNINDFNFLEVHTSKQVQQTGDVLRKLLDLDFDSIPPFDGKIQMFHMG